jgi:hypothetical protein
LYFLPEPQGQGSLRPTLPQVDGFCGSRLACSAATEVLPLGAEAGIGKRHLVFAGGRVKVVRLTGRPPSRLGRPLLDFDVAELADNGAPQTGKERLEQLEPFRLVFVQRVALRVAAEADHRAQVIKRSQMLAPQVVERLQKHLFSTARMISGPKRAALRAISSSALP